jgi:hypothetical protein
MASIIKHTTIAIEGGRARIAGWRITPPALAPRPVAARRRQPGAALPNIHSAAYVLWLYGQRVAAYRSICADLGLEPLTIYAIIAKHWGSIGAALRSGDYIKHLREEDKQRTTAASTAGN